MLDQIFGLLLVGLGIQTPVLPAGSVLGDETEVTAEGSNTATNNKQIRPERVEVRKDTVNIRNDRKDVRTNLKEGDKAGAAAARKEVIEGKQERRDDVNALRNVRQEDRQNKKTEIEIKRDQLKSQIEEKRQQAKAEFQERRDAFKQRLEAIKDERKKTIVQNVDQGLSRINSVRTDTMSNQLSRMEEILAKANQRVEQIEANGTNPDAAATAITAATVAISVAKTSVTTQAGKEYIIGITTENDLGRMVEKTRMQLETDLATSNAAVKNAREEIAKAIQEVAILREGN